MSLIHTIPPHRQNCVSRISAHSAPATHPTLSWDLQTCRAESITAVGIYTNYPHHSNDFPFRESWDKERDVCLFVKKKKKRLDLLWEGYLPIMTSPISPPITRPPPILQGQVLGPLFPPLQPTNLPSVSSDPLERGSGYFPFLRCSQYRNTDQYDKIVVEVVACNQ